MKQFWQETGWTVREAIKGWPATLRLAVLMVVAAAIWTTVTLLTR